MSEERRAGTAMLATRLRGGGGERSLRRRRRSRLEREARRDSDRRWVGLVSQDYGEEEKCAGRRRLWRSGEEVERSEIQRCLQRGLARVLCRAFLLLARLDFQV
jgi:hypothetical protein